MGNKGNYRRFTVKATSEIWSAGDKFDAEGAFETVRYQNDDGFVIGQFRTKDGDTIVCKGKVPGFVLGAPYHIVGKVVNDKNWGIQVDIKSAGGMKPTTEGQLIAFLGSGAIPGIGPITAKNIVKTFGKDTIDVLENNPQRLIEVPGIGKKSIGRMVRELPQQLKYREIIGFFSELGISVRTINRLISEYGSRTREVIEKNPYILCRVRGFAFTRADSIAMKMGIAPNDPKRIYAGILATLRWMCDAQGHTVVPSDMLLDETLKKLNISDRIFVERLLDKLAEDEKIIIDETGCHLKHLYYAEKNIKACLKKTVQDDNLISGKKVEELMEKCSAQNGLSLTDEQQNAVKNLFRKRVSVMSGGAGTGKCQPLYSKILTEQGWKTMGELEVGMRIYTREGTLCPIKKLYPQGKKTIYRVHFIDGRHVDCCKDHIWTVYTPNGELIDRTVAQMLEHGIEETDDREAHHKYFYRVPMNNPIQFPEQDLPIDPYVLGMLIDNGFSSGTEVVFSTSDYELLNELGTRLPEYDIHKLDKPSEEGETCHWGIAHPKQEHNPLLKAFSILGFDVGAARRRIPLPYLRGSVNQRRDLLKGLMDSDGCCQDGTVSFSTGNAGFRDDFIELCQSLGYSVTCCNDSTPGKREMGECWTVLIKTDDVDDIFGISMKKEAFHECASRSNQDSNPENDSLSIVEIECLDEKTEMQCLELDQDETGEHLYITDNYIVTHNTATCKMAVDIAKAAGYTVCLMAPTGRAAKHLSEVCDAPGYTMHRALAITVREAEDDDFFSDDIAKTITTSALTEAVQHFSRSDIVIADEASMMDTEMASILFKACRKKHLMLVGDPNQLPSVGPGRVLGDIMDSSYSTIHGILTRLTKIFRQAEGSPVIAAANRVIEGKSPCYVPGVTFVECDNEHVREAVEKRIVPMIKDNKLGYDQWMVLSPMKKTPFSGVNSLNAQLRPHINPYYKKPKSENLEFLLQRGDLVMQTRNNYEVDIYNGDIGIVEDVDSEGNVEVLFSGDDETVVYEKDETGQVIHAFSMSVHKSQGGQAKTVFVILTSSHFAMLNRNLLYTAVTRAEENLVLVGEARAFAMAARNQKENNRITGLAGI